MLDRVLNTSLFSSISQRRLKKNLISTIYLHISKCRANSCWFASEICRYFWIIMAGINNLLDIMNIPSSSTEIFQGLFPKSQFVSFSEITKSEYDNFSKEDKSKVLIMYYQALDKRFEGEIFHSIAVPQVLLDLCIKKTALHNSFL